jgi:hypothetical protein
MKTTERKIWNVIKTVLFDRKVVSIGVILLAVVFLDFLFLHQIILELDILEHFLFGFVLSEFTSKSARALGLDKHLTMKLNSKSRIQSDLVIRIIGFLLIGGLLWESSERFLFPMFGATYQPFFTLPITLNNIDGAIDVTVGTLGCITAYYT